MSLLSLILGHLEEEGITESKKDKAELEEKLAAVTLLVTHRSGGTDKKKLKVAILATARAVETWSKTRGKGTLDAVAAGVIAAVVARNFLTPPELVIDSPDVVIAELKGPDLFATWEVMFGHTKNPSSGSRKWYKVKRNTSSFNASTAPFHHKGEHVSGLHFMVKVEFKKFTASNCFRFEA